MSEVIFSPVTIQDTKNATSDGIVIIAPMMEPFRNIPFVGLGLLLSTSVLFVCDNKNQDSAFQTPLFIRRDCQFCSI